MISEIIKKIKAMPPLSTSAMKLLALAGKDSAASGDYAGVVALDPSLTMSLLKAVNSPIYGLMQPVTSVARAVALVGERLVVALALSAACPRVFQSGMPGYAAERGEMFRHGLFAGLAARLFAAKARQPLSPDLAFTAGILHDIGKAVLAEFLSGRTVELLGQVDQGLAGDFREAEKDALGADHAEVGYLLAQCWNIPSPLPEAIRRHHAPSLAGETARPLAYATHLADLAAMTAGVGTGADTLLYRLDPGYAAYFDFGPEDVEALLMDAREEFEKMVAAEEVEAA